MCSACELPDGHAESRVEDPNPPDGEGEVFCGVYFDAQEDERIRVGRALHDSTGQLLLSLSLSFAHLRETPHDSGLDPSLDEISETISQISREIRTFAFLEYPAELRAGGLAAALDSFARGFAKRTGLRVEFQASGVGEIADPRTALALLRIGQEALVNVYRHADASVVHLMLERHGRELQLTVTDDGRGMPRTAGLGSSHGVGLIGMRHRAERLGGEFNITRLKHGTKIVATVPVRPPEGIEGQSIKHERYA